MNARLRWRKLVSGFMLTMTGVCALVAVAGDLADRCHKLRRGAIALDQAHQAVFGLDGVEELAVEKFMLFVGAFLGIFHTLFPGAIGGCVLQVR